MLEGSLVCAAFHLDGGYLFPGFENEVNLPASITPIKDFNTSGNEAVDQVGSNSGIAGFHLTAASPVFAFYPDLDNIGRSPHAGIHRKGGHRAIVHTGAAFHAGVYVRDSSFAVIHFKHLLGAHLGAKAASYAKIFIELQG
jgi:hypothetical protein